MSCSGGGEANKPKPLRTWDLISVYFVSALPLFLFAAVVGPLFCSVESHLSNPFPGFRYDGPALTINIGADGTCGVAEALILSSFHSEHLINSPQPLEGTFAYTNKFKRSLLKVDVALQGALSFFPEPF